MVKMTHTDTDNENDRGADTDIENDQDADADADNDSGTDTDHENHHHHHHSHRSSFGGMSSFLSFSSSSSYPRFLLSARVRNHLFCEAWADLIQIIQTLKAWQVLSSR